MSFAQFYHIFPKKSMAYLPIFGTFVMPENWGERGGEGNAWGTLRENFLKKVFPKTLSKTSPK
jgi:hypothetical protein